VRFAHREWQDLVNSSLVRAARPHLALTSLIGILLAFTAVGAFAAVVTGGGKVVPPPTAHQYKKATKPTTAETSSIEPPTNLSSAPREAFTTGTGTESCVSEPQPEAPNWAIEGMRQLFGGGSTLGVPEQGCVGRIETHIHDGEIFTTAIGSDPVTKAPRSYAVDSLRYGAVIFLWPAARLAKGLVSQYGPVGGIQPFPRVAAGTGDLYVIATPHGTFTFIRRTVGTPQLARGYTLIPPTVGRAWFGAMHESGGWLWPEEGEERHSVIIYSLRSNETDEVRYRVRYTTQTQRAEREGYDYPSLPVRELSATELHEHLPSA
jgi:hypothetical protein